MEKKILLVIVCLITTISYCDEELVSLSDSINHKILSDNYQILEAIKPDQIGELLALYRQMWWGHQRTKEELEIMLKNSLYLVLIDTASERIIGFVRAISDYVRYANVHDVMIAKEYRDRGLGKTLLAKLLYHPKLSRVLFFDLHCMPDVAPFYNKIGFRQDHGGLIPLRLRKARNDDSIA